MHADQAVYRELFDALANYSGLTVYTDLLAPWVHTHPAEVRWIQSFGDLWPFDDTLVMSVGDSGSVPWGAV
ncbi:MAG: hypothetical protein IPK82_34975 [Polyangiaceae bacterium]|nr:hypothetical protein [Polyangiaceae bacterium]